MCMEKRKGKWTKEEDNLLRKCIDIYGEGRWHKVPLRAGLNRCRKSCRLRWLNYLKPNINREEFKEDEVDLIIRLHRLLGNRWSLIAGRLPGRTANDVKNFWNTHLSKKATSRKDELKAQKQKITKSNIIKPRPRTFSKGFKYWFGTAKPSMGNEVNSMSNEGDICKPCLTTTTHLDNEKTWWDGLLDDMETNETNTSSDQEMKKLEDSLIQQGKSCGSEFSFDLDLWNMFDTTEETWM